MQHVHWQLMYDVEFLAKYALEAGVKYKIFVAVALESEVHSKPFVTFELQAGVHYRFYYFLL